MDGLTGDVELLSGIENNRLRRIHPVFNSRFDFVGNIMTFFMNIENKD